MSNDPADEALFHRPGIAGVDEVGRGPLVGAVVAAAVILDPERPIHGLADSKRLTAATRERLADEIQTYALAWSVAEATPGEIDELNILWATMKAMQRAVAGLLLDPVHVLIDGNRCPDLAFPATAVVKGDARVTVIGAASILAKVHRDADMLALHQRHPEYGFDRHKGYPTRAHIEALQRHGPLPEHRRGFGPVARVLVERGLV
jgi:ribonuclease HII